LTCCIAESHTKGVTNYVEHEQANKAIADVRNKKVLYALAMEHLAKLAEYAPGPVRKRGTRENLLAAYRQDPVFSIFGLDSAELCGAGNGQGIRFADHEEDKAT
jgi:hypothetical protein